MYALIGENVESSISNITHNALFQELGVAASYIKIAVGKKELPSFMQWARAANFRGLSVTMPHKIAIMEYLDEIDPEARAIGAVNTLLFEKGKIIGYNTDGVGALRALEAHTSVKGKEIVLLGQGGAARAIEYEAIKRGALVQRPAYRDPESLLGLSPAIWINATPSSMPLDNDKLKPGQIVFDINTKPAWTPLLQEAARRSCQIVFGSEMFIHQALGQFHLWFPTLDLKLAQAILEKSSAQVLLI